MAKARRPSARRPAAPTFYARSANPVESRVPCGEYHTQSGKVGATIRRSTDQDGRVTYSYTGEWGAGSGHSADYMRREVAKWLDRKRGVKVITPFVGAAGNPMASAPHAVSERGLVWAHRPDGSYKADGTGGTFWLMPVVGGYRTVWMGAHGVERDLGVHAYGSAVQVAARFDPVSGQQQQAAENPVGSLLDPSFGDRYRGAAENPRGYGIKANLQQGERLRIRSKGPEGQPFESFWFTVPSPMTPEEVALQFAQTGQPGMLIEIVSGKLKWTYRQEKHAGLPAVTRVRAAENPIGEDRRPYDEALAIFRIASAKFGKAQQQYRARTIGDAEFLAARKEFDAAQAALDVAEANVPAENPRGTLHVEVVELPKWGSDRSKWTVKVNGRTVGSYWNKEHADKKAESLRSGASENPGQPGWRGSGWYRWSVLYRDAPGGPVKQEIVDNTTRENAILSVRVMHPNAVDFAASKQSSKMLEAAENPLDTSVDGWTRWHGDPPNEVGNLGPGQQVQTADGWWYRQDTGADAGHLFFQAADPNGPVMLGPVELPVEVESIAYETATFPPVDVDVVPEVFATPLPPTEELSLPVDAGPIELPAESLAVENPITNGDLAGKAFKYLDVDWELSQTIPSQQGSDVYTALVDQGRYGGHGMIRVAVDGSWRDAATLLPVGEVEPWITYVNRGRAARGLSPLAFRPEARENPRGRRGGDANAWRSTPDGDAKYRAARAEAQQKANEFGYDYGIEPNDIFKSWNIMMLPRAENRAGYELRVEVVHPEGRTQVGHGPGARENPRRRKEPNEFLQGLEAKKAARAAVFAALQSDPVYNRLFERKDAALRAWNQADEYKNHPAHKPGEVEAADRRAKYAMKQVNDYEEAALRKAGCW